MIGFWLPGLGRSRTADWTIEGGHLAERCQLFVIVALGESILVTGATLGSAILWHQHVLLAFAIAFVASVAMWWIYFDTGSRAGSNMITHSNDPGRFGAFFHYVHPTILAGVIVMAVATELWIAHRSATPARGMSSSRPRAPRCICSAMESTRVSCTGGSPVTRAWPDRAGDPDALRLAREPAGRRSVGHAILIGVAAWETVSRRGTLRQRSVSEA